ncbi:MAG: UDP-N-acetylglucosamine 2-epimerase, partial [Acidimicrobiia bacterium]
VQEETTMLDVPCVTVRPNTERPITITHGTNRLTEPEGLVAAVRSALAARSHQGGLRPPLWDGHAGERTAVVLARWTAAN